MTRHRLTPVRVLQQPGDRNCKSEAIGGQHYGPITVYMSKVDNAATSDASGAFFKIYESGWSSKGSARGDDDNWAVKDMNACCGRVDVKIPTNIPNGDYLLRAEVLALHAASGANGAQSYPACYQITVAGGTGTGIPSPTTKFPGAYSASDPGVKFDIHSKISSYKIPGPAVIEGGTTKVAGSGCTGQCEKSCTPGKGTQGVVITEPTTGGGSDSGSGTQPSGCSLAAYQQCGGNTYTGCTTCGVSPPRSWASYMTSSCLCVRFTDNPTGQPFLQGGFASLLLPVPVRASGWRIPAEASHRIGIRCLSIIVSVALCSIAGRRR